MSSNLVPTSHNSSMNQSINNPNIPSSNHFELENQFILRMPLVKDENGNVKPHPKTAALREALASKFAKIAELNQDEIPPVDDIKERLFVELNSDSRKGRIKFDDEIFEARLVDLPCIIESLKTTDKKMFYKTADICQMLVCKTQDDPWNSSDEELNKSKKTTTTNKKKESDKNAHNHLMKYKWPHGIAPPLKNVRRKRFRKVAKKKIVDYAEIEKEVKQIFRADRDASKIDYEVILVEGELDDENDENKNSDRNNSLLNEDEYDSSQEDMNAIIDGNSCMDSALDGDSRMQAKNMKRVNKQSNLIEESNMSFVDEDSMMANSIVNKSKMPETDAEDGETTNLNPPAFDECSMDNSNLPDQGGKSSKHTGFKDLFVKDVLGDLSSSDEEHDGNEDDDDEEEKKEEKIVKSFKFNLDKNSIHMTSKESDNTFHDEESMSNLEDSNMGFNNAYESEASNIESTMSKFVEANEDANRQQINKTKNLDILDPNSRTGDDDENDISLEATVKKNNKPGNEFNFGSDLSSSSSDSMDTNKVNRSELNAKLTALMDELERITEDREKREREIKNINNPVLKANFTTRLNNLIEDQNRKQSEIDELKEKLNE